MSAQFQSNLMSKTLAETEWGEYLCGDLIPILTLLRQQYGARVYEVIHDLKGVYTDVYLEEKIPAQVIAQLVKEFSSNPNLRFGDGWVACKRDYCSIGPKGSGVKGRVAAVMPEPFPPVTSLREGFFTLLIGLVFVAGGIWIVLYDPNTGLFIKIVGGWGSIVFFGLVAVVSVKELLRKR